MKWLIRLFTALALAASLAGCGVKTAYNNADWLLIRWVEERVSLTEAQERDLRASLEGHLAWHCASELPAYAAFLQQVDTDVVAGRIDEKTIEGYGERVSYFGRRLLDRVRPSLIDLLASLDDEQIAELVASFKERNRELADEAESYAEQEAVFERADGFEKSMRRFSGRLTDIQRERLHAWAASLRATAELVLQQRRQWQAEFQRVMRMRHDRDRFEAAMNELLQPGLFATSTLKRQREHNRARTIEIIVELHAMAPAAQIERLRNNLTDFSDDLEQLSCST